jgi:hypothetical protein
LLGEEFALEPQLTEFEAAVFAAPKGGIRDGLGAPVGSVTYYTSDSSGGSSLGCWGLLITVVIVAGVVFALARAGR